MSEKTSEERKEERKRSDIIIVDLGRKSSKNVRRLRKGRGPLLDDVEDCVEELREANAISATVQPVVVIVERRLSSRDLMPFFVPPGLSSMIPFARREDDDDDDDDEDDDDEDDLDDDED
jgi:hypothetical protein